MVGKPFSIASAIRGSTDIKIYKVDIKEKMQRCECEHSLLIKQLLICALCASPQLTLHIPVSWFVFIHSSFGMFLFLHKMWLLNKVTKLPTVTFYVYVICNEVPPVVSPRKMPKCKRSIFFEFLLRFYLC